MIQLCSIFDVKLVLGAIAASGVLHIIASGKAGFDLSSGFAANGYAGRSPGGYSLGACLLAEIVLTFFFLRNSPLAAGRRPDSMPPARHAG